MKLTINGKEAVLTDINTCEQYVLAELEAERAENEALRERIAELERAADEAEAKKAESPNGEVEPRKVQIFRLNEPFETVYLTVKDAYEFRNSEHGLGLTADEAREKAASEEGLREVAHIRVGWGGNEAMCVEMRIWPCQLRTGSQTFVMDTYNSGRDLMEARVLKDDEDACRGQYFPAYRAKELEALGLELLKKNLLEYADKLDAEAAKSEGDE